MNMEKRKLSIAWWSDVSNTDKHEITTLVISPKRSYKSVTGREIELMYNWAFRNVPKK